MNIKCCIFDLDGVICDTSKYHYLAWKSLADTLGIPFSQQDNEQLKGVSRQASLDIILSLGGQVYTQKEKNRFLQRKNDLYLSHINSLTESNLNPGICAWIDELKRRNILVCLGSASKNARLILEKLNLLHQFDYIVDGTLTSKAKPDPEVFLKSMEHFNLQPEQCVVFEDALAGVKAAKSAKMKCIGIGIPAILKEADLVIPGFSAIDISLL